MPAVRHSYNFTLPGDLGIGAFSLATMPRKIAYIVIHCSATDATQDFRLADIDRWHRRRGWNGCGYHFVVDLDGTIEMGRPVAQVGAHVYGYNKNSIGICYIGGLCQGQPDDTRTDGQRRSLDKLVRELHASFPDAKIVGHRDLSPDVNGDGIIEPWEWLKACPCFDVQQEYKRYQPHR